jgi:hypothetical protein
MSRLFLVLAAGVLATGCSSGPEPAAGPAPERQARAAGASTPTPRPRAHCPPELSNCREATGRILYVERVDPDGDGDAHFVLLSPEGITAPGLTVVDVKRSLRPSPLPGPGERLSAAGPVYRGSYGQRQIEAIELRSGSG